MTVKAFAPAKINLTLHVTGQRADGYHLLDSLVVFADVGDWITVEPTADAKLNLTVSGPLADGVPNDESNLVMRAARLSGLDTGLIALEKHLPAEAGIGGGSSDAAATLRAIAELTGTDVPSGTEFLGADVPVCLAAQAARMRGTGEIVEQVQNFPKLHAILVNPGIPVPTPAVFGAMTDRNNPPMPDQLPSFKSAREVLLWLADMRNDLEPAARSLFPDITMVLAKLSALSGVYLTRMSGSGSTCFALFESQGLAEFGAKDLHQ